MGHDAVFVNLFEKYHSKGVSNWLNEKQMETITKRAYMQMANLIGAQGYNLEMIDSTGKRTDLYDVKAEKKKDWVNYIKEQKIGDWIHVYQTAEMEKAITDAQKPSYRQLYDVTQTPTLLMLDKDKRIIGKRLGFLQLNDMLEARIKAGK